MGRRYRLGWKGRELLDRRKGFCKTFLYDCCLVGIFRRLASSIRYGMEHIELWSSYIPFLIQRMEHMLAAIGMSIHIFRVESIQ